MKKQLTSSHSAGSSPWNSTTPTPSQWGGSCCEEGELLHPPKWVSQQNLCKQSHSQMQYEADEPEVCGHRALSLQKQHWSIVPSSVISRRSKGRWCLLTLARTDMKWTSTSGCHCWSRLDCICNSPTKCALWSCIGSRSKLLDRWLFCLFLHHQSPVVRVSLPSPFGGVDLEGKCAFSNSDACKPRLLSISPLSFRWRALFVFCIFLSKQNMIMEAIRGLGLNVLFSVKISFLWNENVTVSLALLDMVREQGTWKWKFPP